MYVQVGAMIRLGVDEVLGLSAQQLTYVVFDLCGGVPWLARQDC